MICPKKIFYRSLKKKLRKKDTVFIFAALLAIAIALSYAAGKFTILPLDLESYYELQEEASPSFNMMMHGVSALGELALSMGLTMIIVLAFAVRRQWLEAIFMLATTITALVFLLISYIRHGNYILLVVDLLLFVLSLGVVALSIRIFLKKKEGYLWREN
jgi:hypothetical protein